MYYSHYKEKKLSIECKLEDRSWRELAIKLASNVVKMHQQQLEAPHVEKYLHAIQRKQQIDDGRYISHVIDS